MARTYTVKLSRVITQRFEAFVTVTSDVEDPGEAMGDAAEQAELLAERGFDADGKPTVEWSGDDCDGNDGEIITAEEVEEVE